MRQATAQEASKIAVQERMKRALNARDLGAVKSLLEGASTQTKANLQHMVRNYLAELPITDSILWGPLTVGMVIVGIFSVIFLGAPPVGLAATAYIILLTATALAQCAVIHLANRGSAKYFDQMGEMLKSFGLRNKVGWVFMSLGAGYSQTSWLIIQPHISVPLILCVGLYWIACSHIVYPVLFGVRDQKHSESDFLQALEVLGSGPIIDPSYCAPAHEPRLKKKSTASMHLQRDCRSWITRICNVPNAELSQDGSNPSREDRGISA